MKENNFHLLGLLCRDRMVMQHKDWHGQCWSVMVWMTATLQERLREDGHPE